jgi:crossover junction endodeoxyribonuclease RusA
MKNKIKITLPFPPSVNTLYATHKGRRILSKEGRQFKKAVALLVGKTTPTANEVAVTVEIYRPRRTSDLDNRLKGLLDSMTGLFYVDDKQIVEIHAYRFEDKSNPRAEVEIQEL